MAVRDDIRRMFNTGGISVKIIVVLTAAFLLTNIINFIVISTTYDSWQVANRDIQSNLWWLSLNADTLRLIKTPWTIFTHGLLHSGFGHFFWNMIGIWIFGRIVTQFTDDRRYLSLFILSVAAGGLIYVASMNLLIGPEALSRGVVTLAGASGGIMGLLGAALFYAPNMRFNLIFVQPPLWLIALIYLILDFVTITSLDVNFGGSIAHVSGFGFGYLASRLYSQGTDLLGWFSRFIDWLVNLFKGVRNPRPKMRVKYKNSDFKKQRKKEEAKRRKSDEEYNLEKKDRQAKIDSILDKIKKSGYESLTKAEKDYLFNEGKKL